jgi:hypothetical protein
MQASKRKNWPVRIIRQVDDSPSQRLSPAEGLGAMWQLTLDAWALKLAAEGEEAAERYNALSRLQRHIVRIVRPSDREKEANER